MTPLIPALGELATPSINLLAALRPDANAGSAQQANIQNAATSGSSLLAEAFSQFEDIVTLSPEAQQFINSAISGFQSITSNLLSQNTSSLAAEDGFGLSAGTASLSLDVKSLSYSSISGSDGVGSSKLSSFSAVNLSINATTEVKFDNGQFYAVSKVSISYQGISASSASSSNAGGSASSLDSESLNVNVNASSQTQLGLAGAGGFNPGAVEHDAIQLLSENTGDDTKDILATILDEPVDASELFKLFASDDEPSIPTSGENFGINNFLTSALDQLQNSFDQLFTARLDLDFAKRIEEIGGLFSSSGLEPFTDANSTSIQILEANFSFTSATVNSDGSAQINRLEAQFAALQYTSQSNNYANTLGREALEEIVT